MVNPDWIEPTNLYLVPVMAPGSRKSAVVAATTAPLYQVEAELVEAAATEQWDKAVRHEIAVKVAERAAQGAAKEEDPAERAEMIKAAAELAKRAEELKPPPSPRLIADDVTDMALASLMADYGGRMAIISAEGGIFDMMAGKYNAGKAVLEVWLKGHAGDRLRVDRKGRPAEQIEKPALTMLLTVQPAVLAALGRNTEFRGKGLLARNLYSIPPDNVGYRQIGAAPVPPEVKAAYTQGIVALAKSMAGPKWTPVQLTLAPDAGARLREYQLQIEPRLRIEGAFGEIRDWASKLVGASVRLAGLLHAASPNPLGWARTPISDETMRAAIALADYFTEHAQTAFGTAVGAEVSDAQYLLDHLRQRDLDDFTVRDLLVKLPRQRFPNVASLRAAIDVLDAHGWLYLTAPSATERAMRGRPRSACYLVHPSVCPPAKARSGRASRLKVVPS